MADYSVNKINDRDTKNLLVVSVPNAKDAKETFVTQESGKIVQLNKSPIELGVLDRNLQMVDLTDASDTDRREIQSTLLLKRKQEMSKLQTELEEKRAEFTRRMELSRAKRDELSIKQQQFRDRVHKFEKFLKESDAKRQRANLKAQAERKIREQKEVEFEQLLVQLNDLQRSLARAHVQIKRHKRYEAYLQTVLRKIPPDQLDSNDPQIHDLIQRFQTLQETNYDLVKTLQGYQDEIEAQMSARNAMIKDKNDHILVSNSELSRLQKQLDGLKQQHAYLILKMESKESNGKERAQTFGAIKLAIDSLFDKLGGKSTFLFGKPQGPVQQDASQVHASAQPAKDSAPTAEVQNATFVTQNQGASLSPTLLNSAAALEAQQAAAITQANADSKVSLFEKLSNIQEKVLDFGAIINKLLAQEKANRRTQLLAQQKAQQGKHSEDPQNAKFDAKAVAQSSTSIHVSENRLRVVRMPVYISDPAQSPNASLANFSSSANNSSLSISSSMTSVNGSSQVRRSLLNLEKKKSMMH